MLTPLIFFLDFQTFLRPCFVVVWLNDRCDPSKNLKENITFCRQALLVPQCCILSRSVIYISNRIMLTTPCQNTWTKILTLETHCCRLQAVYSPITVKIFAARPCILDLTPAIEVIYYLDYRKCLLKYKNSLISIVSCSGVNYFNRVFYYKFYR